MVTTEAVTPAPSETVTTDSAVNVTTTVTGQEETSTEPVYIPDAGDRHITGFIVIICIAGISGVVALMSRENRKQREQ